MRVCVPPKLRGEILTRSRTLRLWDHEGGASHDLNGISVLPEKVLESFLAPLPCENTVRRQLSIEAGTHQTLNLLAP